MTQRGPKPKLTSEIKTKICAMTAVGYSRREAAEAVGCTHAGITYAAAHDEQFESNLAQAQVDAELKPLRRIYRAGRRSWRANAWILERVRPDKYAQCKKPDMVPRREAAHGMERLAQAIAAGEPDPERREEIMALAEQMSGELRDTHDLFSEFMGDQFDLKNKGQTAPMSSPRGDPQANRPPQAPQFRDEPRRESEEHAPGGAERNETERENVDRARRVDSMPERSPYDIAQERKKKTIDELAKKAIRNIPYITASGVRVYNDMRGIPSEADSSTTDDSQASQEQQQDRQHPGDQQPDHRKSHKEIGNEIDALSQELDDLCKEEFGDNPGAD